MDDVAIISAVRSNGEVDERRGGIYRRCRDERITYAHERWGRAGRSREGVEVAALVAAAGVD